MEAARSAKRWKRGARLVAAIAAALACLFVPAPARADSEADAVYAAWAAYFERWDTLYAPSPSAPRLVFFRVEPRARWAPIHLGLPPPAEAPREGPTARQAPPLAANARASPERPAGPAAAPARVGLHHSLWFVTLELFVVQTASIGIFAALPQEISGFSTPSFSNIAKYAAQGPRFDDDRWYFNYIGHPLAGSEYYLIARNRSATWWQSFFYAAAWSAFWEYVTEGLYERASIQDLIVTPVAGAVLGEIRYRLRRELVDPMTGRATTWPLQLLVIALDPIQALATALPL